MATFGLIPARGGSKRIPRKNVQSFNGKPLIQWTIEAAMKSSLLDEVVVSTDDSDIAELSRSLGVRVPFMRPKRLATDHASGMLPVLHALDFFPDATRILLLQPTSPLRIDTDIDGIIDMQNRTQASSIVSVSKCQVHPSWMFRLDCEERLTSPFEEHKDTRSQDLETFYRLNGALYLATRDFIVQNNSFIGEETLGYRMPETRSHDIDTLLDWKLAEFAQKAL